MENNTKNTDFFKLMIAKSYIKMLKKQISELEIENGMKQSEIDELKDLVHRAQLGQVSKEEFVEIVKNEIIQSDRESYMVAIENRNNKIKRLVELHTTQMKELKVKVHSFKKDRDEFKRKFENVQQQNIDLVTKITSKDNLIEKLSKQ